MLRHCPCSMARQMGVGKRSRSPSRAGSVSSATCGALAIPHTFEVHSYTRPTVCRYCKKLLRGLFKQVSLPMDLYHYCLCFYSKADRSPNGKLLL